MTSEHPAEEAPAGSARADDPSAPDGVASGGVPLDGVSLDWRQLLERVAILEAHLAQRSAEVRQLRLQLDVFSTTDAGTGLANRNGMADLIELSLARLERRSEPFAIAVIGFPALERGDDSSADQQRAENVQHVSALLTAGLRRMDRTARIGPGVFAAVLPDLTSEHVRTVERRLRSILSVSDDLDLDARIAVVLVDIDSSTSDAVDLLERAERLQAELGPGRTAVVAAP